MPSILADPATYAHVPWALGLQAAGWALGRLLGAANRPAVWLGWLAGATLCITREVTQREYQWIEAHGRGLRANMPPLAGFRVWEWNAHSIAETLTALAATTAVALIVGRKR